VLHGKRIHNNDLMDCIQIASTLVDLTIIYNTIPSPITTMLASQVTDFRVGLGGLE
jgi:hypothetical protein